MILTLNPGGDGKHFRQEDYLNFKKGNFSVQSFHSYLKPRDPNTKMAPAIQEFFENDELLEKTVTIPILVFRSINYDYWKEEFAKLNSEEERKEAELLSYEIARTIIQKVNPRKILMVSFKTLDKVVENSVIPLQMDEPAYGYYGKSKQRIFATGKWNKTPVFCIRHLTRAPPTPEHKKKMKHEFFRFLKE